MSESNPSQVRLRPELLDDVAEAFRWYESQGRGLGDDFQRAFFAAVSRAARQPQIARTVYADFRRVRLRRYPYSLYYCVEANETIFFLLFHGARDSKLIQRTLKARRSTI